MMIECNERIPTEWELRKLYGFTEFPNGKTDECCGGARYLIDFITHRLSYHKLTMKETIRELEEFLEEIK